MPVFDFTDYKKFLEAESASRGQRSGFKSALARACQCDSAYISNVFAGKSHLSLEQAERASQHLSLTEAETHYFLLLVQRARAGSRDLQRYFDRQIQDVLEQRLNIQKRLGAPERLSKTQQSRYYRSWIYSAAHIALAIPRLARSEEALSQYLGVPIRIVREAQEFLIAAGMIARTPKGIELRGRHTHLSKKSDDLVKHHTNWRIQALRAIENETDESLHYSSVIALSKADTFRIREIYLEAIKKSADVILESKEEEVFAMTLDFFPLKNESVL